MGYYLITIAIVLAIVEVLGRVIFRQSLIGNAVKAMRGDLESTGMDSARETLRARRAESQATGEEAILVTETADATRELHTRRGTLDRARADLEDAESDLNGGSEEGTS